MSKTIRILFTGVGRRIELIQAFKEASLVLNKHLIIYGADMAGTAPALTYCDYIRKVVSMRDSNYIDNLIKICSEDCIDLIIPTIDTDLLILSQQIERFNEIGTRVLISSPEMIKICRDKNLTSQFFVGCGLHAPMPVNDWKLYKLPFPAFIKPKDGSSSINAFKVNSSKELELYANRIGDYIIQPFIQGHEYTIDIFCDFGGKPISIVPRERLQVRAGEVLQTRIKMDQALVSEARVICEKFKPCGPLTVQLIRDKDGLDWFIEINPRYGGGAPLSIKAGARSPEAILKLIDNEMTEYFEDIEDDAVYCRFDQSVCVSSGNNKCFKGVIFDLDDTLYSEKEYVRSGYLAVARYLGNMTYADSLWSYFDQEKPAIDMLLRDIGLEEEKEKVLDIYRSHIPNIVLYEGVIPLLKRLRKENIKIGIITDGRPKGQRNKISALGLYELVDDIIITDELGGPQFRKPCDIAYRIIQTKWRIPASQIVYIGDNAAKDFQAPKQLGMKYIEFMNKDGLYFSNSSCEGVNSISEIFDYLL